MTVLRRALLLLILSGMLLAGYFFMPQFLGEVVKEIFRDGTGCKAHLKHPQISLFTLSATIEDVSIICPEETGSEGFFIEKLTASISLDHIKNKTLRVSELKLEGALAKSLVGESAFLRTLKFILKKPPGPRPADDARGWHVWVPKVEIFGKKSEPSLYFGIGDFYIAGESVEFTSDDPIDSQFTPVILRATSTASYLAIGGKRISLGDVDYEAEAGGGTLKFTKAKFSHGQEQINIQGDIDTKRDLLNLTFDGVARLQQLGDEIGLKSQSLFEFKGVAVNSLFTPEISSSLKFLLEDARESVHQMKGSISQILFKEGILKVQDLKIDSMLGKDKNLSKVDMEIEKADGGLLGRIDISSLPLFLLVDMVSVFGDFNSFNQELIQKDILNSKLNFQGSGLLNLENLLTSKVVGSGRISKGSQDLLNLNVSLQEDGLNFNLVDAIGQKSIVNLRANDSNIEGSLSLPSVSISNFITIPVSIEAYVSTLDLNGNISGHLEDPKFQGSYTIGGKPLEERIGGDLSINKLGLISNFKSPTSSMSGSIEQSFESGEVKLALDLLNLNSKSVPYLAASIEENIVLTGKVSYRGLPSSPFDADGDLKVVLKLPESLAILQPAEALHLKLQNGELKMDDINLPLPLKINGSIYKSKGWNVDLAGLMPLSILAHNIDVLEGIQGNLRLSSQVRGEFFNPEIFGQARIEESSFNLILGNIILGAEGIHGVVNFSGNKIEVQNLTGELADGVMILRGQAENIFSKENRYVNLVLDSRNMKIEPANGLFIDLSSSLGFSVQKNIPTLLRGNVEIEEAVYENAVNLDTLISAVTAFIKNGLWASSGSVNAERLSGILVDVHVASKGGMLLDTNVLQAEFLGDLHVQSDLLNPRIDGKVTVLDGGFKVNQTEFQILSGELLFSDQLSSLNPKVTMTSEGSLRNRSGDETKIFLSIGGNIKNTKLSLTSEGQATSRDLAKQLGVGGGGNQVKLVDDKLANVGFRELLSPSSDLTILERVSGLTGFDDVRVETGVSVRTGEFIPQVFASRPLPADFRGTLSSELSGDKASGGKLEYRLDDSYSVFSSWRSQAVTASSQTGGGNIGFGFQYRRTFKGISLFANTVKSSEETEDDE